MSDNYVMKRCCHCNTMAEYLTPSDYNNATYKNLDGRPYETDCFSLKTTVMHCPKCGYVSFDISENILKDPKIVATKEYESILSNTSLPKEVNSFLALGYIYEKQEDFYHASHAYLSGAWLCQDLKYDKYAKSLLEKSALGMLLFINSDKFKAKPDIMLLQCAVDLLRQIGKFDDSKKLADFALKKCANEETSKIFLLEKSLCENYITAPHAYKAETTSIVNNIETLIKRFIETENLSNDDKAQAFNDCYNYVSSLMHDKLDNGVEIIFNPNNNKSLNYSEFLADLTKLSKNEVVNAEPVVNLLQKKEPAFAIPKVITNVKDIIDEKQENLEKQVNSQGIIEDENNFSEERLEEPIKEVEKVSNENIEEPQEFSNDSENIVDDNSNSPIDEKAVEENALIEDGQGDNKIVDNDIKEDNDVSNNALTQETIEENGDSFVENEEETLEEDLLTKEENAFISDEVCDSEDKFEETNVSEERAEEILENEELTEEVSDVEQEDKSYSDAEETTEEVVNNDVEEGVKQSEDIFEEDIDLTKTVDIIFDDDVDENAHNLENIKDAKESDDNTDVKNEEIAAESQDTEEPEECINDFDGVKQKGIEDESDEEELEDIDEDSESEEIEEESIEESIEDDTLVDDNDDENSQNDDETDKNNSTQNEEEKNDDDEIPPIDDEELINTVLALASLDGLISISEVQSLFEYGYVQAKGLLDKIVDLGKLELKEDGQSYKFIKK